MNKLPITLIVLTYNEEIHIARCLESVRSLVSNIVVIDSGSSDRTKVIVEENGGIFIHHDWPGYQAAQFNWALDNIGLKTEWVLRLDADEFLLPETVEEIKNKLPGTDATVTGIYLKRRVYFKGKWIRFGGYYPTTLLRLWKHAAGKYEDVQMDEHVKLISGNTRVLKNDFVDENLNDIYWWIEKHNIYSTREAAEIIKAKEYKDEISSSLKAGRENRKRWFKGNLYYKAPLFFRAYLYFIYRYFFRLGFLDGRRGLMWHFLQGYWYRFIVDVKILEHKKKSENEKII